MNTGRYPVDADTEIGQIRVLVGDTDPSNIRDDPEAPGEKLGDYFWYSDAELENLLKVRGSGAARTAIYVLRMVAMTPAMQYKKWSSADLSVDGPAITRAIRELINDIEKGLDDQDAGKASDFFRIVDTGPAVSQPAAPRVRIRGTGGAYYDDTLPLGLM